MIYVVGIIDDVVGLGAKTKFAVQIVAATLLPISGLYINNLYGFCGITEIPFWVGAPLTVFVIVFIDNAINLIDGIDGLAGGLALMSLLGFLVCFAREGVWSYCVLFRDLWACLQPIFISICGVRPSATARFSWAIRGQSDARIHPWFPCGEVRNEQHSCHALPQRQSACVYTLLIVPCFDVVRVIITRLRDHQPLFKADKRPIHHKL